MKKPSTLLLIAACTTFLMACAPKLEVIETYADGAKKTSAQFLGDGVEGTREIAFIFHYSPLGELTKRENLVKKVTEYYPDLHKSLSNVKGLSAYFEGEWLAASTTENNQYSVKQKFVAGYEKYLVLLLTPYNESPIETTVENKKTTKTVNTGYKGIDDRILVISPRHFEGKFPCLFLDRAAELLNDDSGGSIFSPEEFCVIKDHNTFLNQKSVYSRVLESTAR